MSARAFLERALAAEDRAEAAEAALADMRRRLNAAVGADPTSATHALGWMARAHLAENLLREVLRYVDQRSLPATDLPDGWVPRARSQLAAADISDRDVTNMDRAAEQQSWAPFTNEDGSPAVLIDRRRDGS